MRMKMGSKDLRIMILSQKKRKNQRKKKDKRSSGWTHIIKIQSVQKMPTLIDTTGRVRSAGRCEIDLKSIGAPTPSCSLIATTVLIPPLLQSPELQRTSMIPPLNALSSFTIYLSQICPHIRPSPSQVTEIYSTPPQSHRFSICNRDTH